MIKRGDGWGLEHGINGLIVDVYDWNEVVALDSIMKADAEASMIDRDRGRELPLEYGIHELMDQQNVGWLQIVLPIDVRKYVPTF